MEKLVRDRIPEIINRHGESVEYYIANETEYQMRLIDKLFEEAEELKESLGNPHVAEEIADVLEVIDAIVKNCGFDMAHIIQIKEDKKQKRGGFDKKYILWME